MTSGIDAESLSKKYGRRQAVDDLSFAVPAGSVCALLGPNGAGKTSTMRMLVGLSTPDGGRARLLGEHVSLGADVLRRVGVLIDGPAFVPHLSGLANLRLFWAATGRAWPPPALDDALDLAGLGEALGRRVRGYSTGMRQRLGLAQALMRSPEVVILDEPANGLDPAEVRALRRYLGALARRGATVLISSHLLAEVQQVATDVVVLNRGRLVAAGRLADLVGGAASLEEAFLSITGGSITTGADIAEDELRTQLLRVRTVIALACLAAVPVFAAFATASHAGQRNGDQAGLFGAATYSALNHTMASLAFTAPLLLPVVVALLGSAIGSADRDWGTLRYLYVAPVSRARLLAGKLGALAITTTVATLSVLVAGVLSGLAVFGAHPFHVIDAPALSTGVAVTRVVAASGFTLLCMLSIAAIAFALGLWLPRGAEAVGAAIGFVVAASILNAQPSLHGFAVLLPVHYWQRWTTLFDPVGTADLGTGALVQAATVLVAVGVAVVVLLHRDPAA